MIVIATMSSISVTPSSERLRTDSLPHPYFTVIVVFALVIVIGARVLDCPPGRATTMLD
jgi:hypothetical protein